MCHDVYTFCMSCVLHLRMLPMTNEISRITKKDMVIGGYHIPAEVSVCVSVCVCVRVFACVYHCVCSHWYMCMYVCLPLCCLVYVCVSAPFLCLVSVLSYVCVYIMFVFHPFAVMCM